MIKSSFLAAVLAVFACSSALASTPVSMKSLEKLPLKELEGYFDPSVWKVVSETPVAGYVILRGKIATAGKLLIREVEEAYPDRSKVDFAKRLAARARLNASTVGTHTRPAADIYVIFYQYPDGSQNAVLYALQHEAVLDGGPNFRDRDPNHFEVVEFRSAADGAVQSVTKGSEG